MAVQNYNIFILVVSVLALTSIFYYALIEYDYEVQPLKRIQNGEILFESSVSSQNISLNENLELTIDTGTKQISLVSKGHKIWSNIAGLSFINCLAGSTQFKSLGGNWKINNELDKNCNQQKVSSIHQSGNTVTIQGNFQDCQDVHFQYNITLKEYSLEPDFLYNKQLYTGLDGKVFLNQKANCFDDSNKQNILVQHFQSTKQEQFIGFGIQYSFINMKNKILSLWSREKGVFRGKPKFLTFLLDDTQNGGGGKWYHTYYPLGLMISSFFDRSYLLKNNQFSAFDLTDPEKVSVVVEAVNVEANLLIGDLDPKNMLEQVSFFTGRMKPLPEWTQEGAILGLETGTDFVLNVTQKMLSHNTSLVGVWMQDWSGARQNLGAYRLWWNWEVDQVLYHDWAYLLKNLSSYGIRITTYINSMLANASSKTTPYRHNYYDIAYQKGYFIKQIGSSDPAEYLQAGGFNAGILDLSNPEAVQWFKDIIKQNMLNETSVYGFMADFGEDVPLPNAEIYDKTIDLQTFHNQYPYLWHKLCREAVEEYYGKNHEVLFWTRSGSLQTPNYTVVSWVGDQLENWSEVSGIGSALRGMLTAGFSGATLTHSDIGGYIAFKFGTIAIERTVEVQQRWSELATFSAIFRTHPGTLLSTVQAYNDSVIDHFAFFSRIFKQLKEYRQSLMKEAYEKGLPLMRHMILEYPLDKFVQKNLLDSVNQFMLGPDFLIAPVLDEGANEVKVYIPQQNGNQTWVHLFTKQKYQSCSCQLTVDAKIGMPAVLFKQGSQYGQKLQDFIYEDYYFQQINQITNS